MPRPRWLAPLAIIHRPPGSTVISCGRLHPGGTPYRSVRCYAALGCGHRAGAPIRGALFDAFLAGVTVTVARRLVINSTAHRRRHCLLAAEGPLLVLLSPRRRPTAFDTRRPMVSLTTMGNVVHRPACRHAGATASMSGGSASPPPPGAEDRKSVSTPRGEGIRRPMQAVTHLELSTVAVRPWTLQRRIHMAARMPDHFEGAAVHRRRGTLGVTIRTSPRWDDGKDGRRQCEATHKGG